MPTYLWCCPICENQWDVIARVADRDILQYCPGCESPGSRGLTTFNFTGAADWNTQTFNPGLGCYTKSHKQAEQIAKSRGLECVGNENPDKIHKHYEKQREETKERRWEDVTREKVYD